ncbi:hypothetical protein M569_05321, partial [Genlisea aurea]
MLSYPTGNVGVLGGAHFSAVSGSMQLPQQPRKFIDLGQQQQGSPNIAQQSQFRNQGFEQQMWTPMQKAYLQYASPAAHPKSTLGMQSQQQQVRPEMFGYLGKDQEMRFSNMNMEELGQQSQQNIMNMSNNSNTMAAQMQAMQALAYDRHVDLSNPVNANVISQLIPLMQPRMVSHQRPSENSPGIQSGSLPKQTAEFGNENSPCSYSSSDISGQSGSSKTRPATPSNLGVPSNSAAVSSPNHPALQQFSTYTRDNSLLMGQPSIPAHGALFMNSLASANLNQGIDFSRSRNDGLLQPPQSAGPSNEGDVRNPPTSRGPTLQMWKSHAGFTKQQLHVLKAQILAFRRLKKGDGSLPRELLQSIVPPPLDLQTISVVQTSVAISNDDNAKEIVSSEKGPQFGKSIIDVSNPSEPTSGDDKVSSVPDTLNSSANQRFITRPGKEDHQGLGSNEKSYPESETGNLEHSIKANVSVDRGKEMAPPSTASDTSAVRKPIQASTPAQTKDAASARKYHGPLFDFPVFTRKHEAFGSSLTNNSNNLALAYDITDLFADGVDAIRKIKRQEKIESINKILAVNLERKRIRPDLVTRLHLESKKLQLADYQACLRDEIQKQQQEIMAMPDRPYRKFLRLCERQRQELNRQTLANLKAKRDKQLKSVFQWRKKLLEAHWAVRDARTARNRGVHKYHEKMLREFSKNNDDDRDKRMEALKNNDVERYREMLLEQQSNVPGEAAERYAVLSSFLTQTEEYLHKLGSKITAAKNFHEVEEAASAAAAAARAQGLSDEEVRAAAACAREEVMIRNRFSEMNAPKDSASVNKYYNLAHAVNESVFKQPSLLRAGTLRDYQLVGLQWMLSLYNNKLNGILADEMGLGKTVMALIAYLMEFKGNYGPHLIIVPNAVLVNWKSELHNWLPAASCIYYVGGKDQRSKLFSQEVLALKFNVLVTTYEFIMYDRSKLSRVDWKYIIIDEAQRMKNRESVLARDLDRYRCQRRLLLTGTPLQNDLKELWSLLNLLLPEVFDNRKAFHDWFSQPFQKEGSGYNGEDDWLETEKKVIVIHRLHQILEPFMLRRRVEDVEGSLPPKVSVVLKCRMSAIQGAIYDWIKATGTLRIDPEDEQRKVQKNPIYQAKTYKTLNNRCMELRKACNHPLLNYPYFGDLSKDFLVRSCGKMWVLDRILIKLQRTGHRVLLFSTMTKLLDIVEEYLHWRRFVFRRIDGTTSLEDRESAIMDFNSPDSDCFIFLLSIRAAGRGLNLQSADTVIIYDPDPNPKNEEQAVARAHRIGQMREVKVIYMEAVVEKISSHQKEDEFRLRGRIVDSDDDLAGKDRYMGSIESLIRNNIQQYKIDMADEVINAGRFDQRTTHEERRMTLETLLHDEERYQETVHDVPSLHEVNRMIARGEEEVDLFDQMDEDLDWTDDMTRYDQVPDWLRPSTKEVNAAIANLSKKPSKHGLYGGNIGVDSTEPASETTERRRGRPKGKKPVYTELEEENVDFSDASSEDKNEYSVQEEGEGEFEEDDESTEEPQGDKDQSEDNIAVDGGSTDSSSHSRKQVPVVSPSLSSQKFGSLSALDCRSNSRSRKSADDVEGEIALSGDSLFEQQQSDEGGEDEQVVQPKIRRKRSIRLRPGQAIDRSNEKSPLHRVDLSQLTFQAVKVPGGVSTSKKSGKADDASSIKSKLDLPRKNAASGHGSLKTGRVTSKLNPPDDASEQHSSMDKIGNIRRVDKADGPKISEIIQRKCKNVISKLQRRIDHEGHQIVPLLTQLWKRIENSGVAQHLVDLRRIHVGLERYEYSSVFEVVSDVQLMLKNGMQHYGFSYEVRDEAKKVHDLFFDILYIAFPDIDFEEARDAMSFFGHHKQPRQKSSSESPFQTPKSRGGYVSQKEDVRFGRRSREQQQISRQQQDVVVVAASSGSSPFAHPGDLVVCKKKRKDREKSSSAATAHHRNDTRNSFQKDAAAESTSSSVQGRSSSVVVVGWANPVKKTRSDANRRR